LSLLKGLGPLLFVSCEFIAARTEVIMVAPKRRTDRVAMSRGLSIGPDAPDDSTTIGVDAADDPLVPL
jgi:hypothetical protein